MDRNKDGKPIRPKRKDYLSQSSYEVALANWRDAEKAWRERYGRSGSSRREYYPGSTRHMGQVHTSRGNPYKHADLQVTDLDGHTKRIHSTDARDMDLGDKVRETMRQVRALLRGKD